MGEATTNGKAVSTKLRPFRVISPLLLIFSSPVSTYLDDLLSRSLFLSFVWFNFAALKIETPEGNRFIYSQALAPHVTIYPRISPSCLWIMLHEARTSATTDKERVAGIRTTHCLSCVLMVCIVAKSVREGTKCVDLNPGVWTRELQND